jgi:membrane fusion protein (multidrug efflux system)
MNRLSVAALAVLGLAIAAAAGYWFGQQRPGFPGAPGGAGPGPGPSGPGASAGPGAQATKGPGGPSGAAQEVVVEAVKVALAAMPQTITAVGSLRSDESVTLRPEVAGRIAAIHFQEGQRVTKGALLVRLDPAVPEAEVQQARANLKLARTKFDRAADLAKSNFISGQAKDEAENNLKVAEAAVQLAEARLAKTEIRAPFSGIIGLRGVSVGDYVKEGADLVNLESIDALKVDFRVPEVYLRQVQVGQSLAVALDAVPGKTFDGKVYAVNPLFDAAGRAIVIRAVVRNAETALRPGMFARVRLFTREAKDAMVVPDTALVPSGDEQWVYRVVDGKARRTKVEIGQRREGMVEVMTGLDAADVVVVGGQQKIRDGTSVQVARRGATHGVAADAKGAAPAEKAAVPGTPPRS